MQSGKPSQLFLLRQPEDPVRERPTKKFQAHHKKKDDRNRDIESFPWMAILYILFIWLPETSNKSYYCMSLFHIQHIRWFAFFSVSYYCSKSASSKAWTQQTVQSIKNGSKDLITKEHICIKPWYCRNYNMFWNCFNGLHSWIQLRCVFTRQTYNSLR